MIHSTKSTAGFLAMNLLLMALGLVHVSEAALQAGDNICVEGFVMDFYCINRGTLLDNPSVRTLEDPGKHSVHCLVDVSSCVSSPFEILLDPRDSEPLYRRGWQLDETSKQQGIELAQSVGTCSTCDPSNSAQNSHVMGFRMVMNATILDLNADDPSIPPTITVHNMEDTTAFVGSASDNGDSSACLVFFGMQDIVDKAAESIESSDGDGSDTGGGENVYTSGGGGGSFLDNIAVGGDVTAASSNALRTKYFAHASLMMVSWGFLLPSGTILAKFYKHRPDGLWFKLHRGIQVLGLLLAVVGWIIALMNFNVFKDYGQRNYQHGICGMIVMILGLLQPLNALLRPHAPESPEDAKSKKRVLWEIWHKASGWLAVLLAVPTIVLGTLSLPSLDDQAYAQIGYLLGCVGGLLALVFYTLYDKHNFQQEQSKADEATKRAQFEDLSPA